METGLTTLLIGALVWLGKKYVSHVEDKTNKKIKDIHHRITLVIEDDAKALLLNEMAALKAEFARRIQVSVDNTLLTSNLRKDMERHESLLKTEHEILTICHKKINQQILKNDSHGKQIADIYKKLEILKIL
jgi:CRISPR/Cas system-associated endoribonuclease Cas2